jgi:hypothetical protein
VKSKLSKDKYFSVCLRRVWIYKRGRYKRGKRIP